MDADAFGISSKGRERRVSGFAGQHDA